MRSIVIAILIGFAGALTLKPGARDVEVTTISEGCGGGDVQLAATARTALEIHHDTIIQNKYKLSDIAK